MVKPSALPFIAALLAALFANVLFAPAAHAKGGDYKFKTKEGCGVRHYRKSWAVDNVASMSWSGKCKHGYTQGKGLLVVTLKSGKSERFEGRMNKGYFGGSKKDNHGEYTDEDGTRQVGEFLNNRLYSGQVYTPNGTLLYDGLFNFKDGRYDQGKLYWEDGGYIEGSFDPDASTVNRSGYGILYGEVKDKDGRTLGYYFRGMQVADAAALQQMIAQLEQQRAEQRAREQAEAEAQAEAEQAQRDADEAAAYQQLTQVLGAYAAAQGQPRAPAYAPPAYTAPQPAYTPPVYSPPAYTPPQPTYSPPVQQGHVHNEALVASQCVQLINDQWGRLQMHNGCSFPIELTWCVVGKDCNPGFSNVWTVGAGANWPVAGEGQRQVQYAACQGKNTIHAVGNPAEMRFQCW